MSQVRLFKGKPQFDGRHFSSARVLVWGLVAFCLGTYASKPRADDGDILRLHDGGGGPQLERVEITVSSMGCGHVCAETSYVGAPLSRGTGKSTGGGGSSGNPSPPAPPKNPSEQGAAPPASEGNTETDCSNPSSSNPVIFATGEKFKVDTDFLAFGDHGLSLQRTYRSYGTGATMFGPKWLSSYDFLGLSLSGCYRHPDYGNLCIPQQVTMTLPDGARHTYTRTSASGGFAYVGTSSATSMGRFIRFPSDPWVLTKNNKVYTYSSAGVIQKIATKGGAVLRQYLYTTSPNFPSRIVDAAGQGIDFTWANGHVVKVKNSSGDEWNYGYKVNGMLETVTSAGIAPDIRTYHYESASDGTLLTGISINGVRHSNYSYYPNRRVQESGLAGGEERDGFVYGTNQTTVTSASGQSTTYNFSSVQGGLKITSVSRAATSTCSATSAQTVYDANGWVDYTLDWRGNKNDYTYDAVGQLLSVTRAADSPSAATSVHTWSGGEIAETTFRDVVGNAHSKIIYAYVPSGLAAGRMSSQTWVDLRIGGQRQTSYGYSFHSNGMLSTLTVTLALPNDSATTTYSYNTSGNLISVTNPLGHQTTWSLYNGLGQPGRVTDPNGVSTDFSYAPNGNLTAATTYLPSGPRTTTYYYNNNRQVTDIVHASGRVDRYRYTASGRLQSAGNALNEFVSFGVDVPTNTLSNGSSRAVPGLSGATPIPSLSGQFLTTKRLDSLGRPYTDLSNNGQQVGYTYDGNSNLKTRTDAAGRITRYDYDALNRLVQVTAPDNGVVVNHYDAEGNLDYVHDPRSLRTTYTYNGLGQVLTQSSPDSGATTYTYDSAGRLFTALLNFKWVAGHED